MGTSMGGMQTWMWGEQYPDFMDALMPLASVQGPISGRNRVWRRVIIDAIRNDPEWQQGNYKQQPQSLRTAEQMLFPMGSNPVVRQRQMPTLQKSDEALDAYVAEGVQDRRRQRRALSVVRVAGLRSGAWRSRRSKCRYWPSTPRTT